MKKLNKYIAPTMKVHQITVTNILLSTSDPKTLNDNYNENEVQESQKENGFVYGL